MDFSLNKEIVKATEVIRAGFEGRSREADEDCHR